MTRTGESDFSAQARLHRAGGAGGDERRVRQGVRLVVARRDHVRVSRGLHAVLRGRRAGDLPQDPRVATTSGVAGGGARQVEPELRRVHGQSPGGPQGPLRVAAGRAEPSLVPRRRPLDAARLAGAAPAGGLRAGTRFVGTAPQRERRPRALGRGSDAQLRRPSPRTRRGLQGRRTAPLLGGNSSEPAARPRRLRRLHLPPPPTAPLRLHRAPQRGRGKCLLLPQAPRRHPRLLRKPHQAAHLVAEKVGTTGRRSWWWSHTTGARSVLARLRHARARHLRFVIKACCLPFCFFSCLLLLVLVVVLPSGSLVSPPERPYP
mmetsp:Transcript_18940/g.58378  ORF Transcript_18940/g.58378 Transcript_18940/m.58378 type:complete len:319 (+) Transcript_18940:100-1056(+)